MAEAALSDFPVEQREFGNVSIAVNASDLPAAKKRLREFIDQFNRDFERDEAQEVYQLNVQFYPLTRPKKD